MPFRVTGRGQLVGGRQVNGYFTTFCADLTSDAGSYVLALTVDVTALATVGSTVFLFFRT